jgi:hypothetical protein
MNTNATTAYSLTLTEDERAELLRLLEAALLETHAEKRRTEAPAYRDRMLHQETLIRALAEKVRRLRP